MLPSRQRLTRQQVTELLEKKGLKVVFNRLGTIKYISSKNPLFTVVTGAKNQKKAVLRNKIRRQLYTLFGKYPENKDINAMLYVSKQVYDMTYSELEIHFYALLQKTVEITR